MKFFSAVDLNNPDIWTYHSGGGSFMTKTGIRVNENDAMSVGAVFACVRVVSETLGMLPIHMFQRVDEGKQRVDTHPLAPIFSIRPNRWQTPMEWVEMMTAHAALRGNGYSRIVGGSNGFVTELQPMNPTRVKPRMTESGSIVYDVRSINGEIETLPRDDVFHLRGVSDGLEGAAIVQLMRETIGLALASEAYGNRFFKNAAAPSGVLEHPKHLSERGKKNMQASFVDDNAGVDNAFNVMVLEEGMKWHQVGMSHEDAQFLETRKFTIQEIARWFRVPPHLIGDLEKATFSNIEQQSLEFVQYSLLPWIRRWESAIRGQLVLEPMKFFPEFTVETLLRGDTASRYAAYQIALQNGIMTRNEVRRFENLNDVPGGDRFIMPLNMSFDSGEQEEEIQELARQSAKAMVSAIQRSFAGGLTVERRTSSRIDRVMESAAKRAVDKEVLNIKRKERLRREDLQGWSDWLSSFYERHSRFVQESVGLSETESKAYCTRRMEDALALDIDTFEAKSNLAIAILSEFTEEDGQ